MNEANLKSALVMLARAQLKHYVVTRHEDVRTSGIPDISIDGNYHTSWWECKMANPEFQSTGIQELTMIRKSVAAHYSAYIIWDVVGRRTYIVHPRLLKNWRSTENSADGLNHQFVVDFIRKVHES